VRAVAHASVVAIMKQGHGVVSSPTRRTSPRRWNGRVIKVSHMNAARGTAQTSTAVHTS
jgi:hypothetical protein